MTILRAIEGWISENAELKIAKDKNYFICKYKNPESGLEYELTILVFDIFTEKNVIKQK